MYHCILSHVMFFSVNSEYQLSNKFFWGGKSIHAYSKKGCVADAVYSQLNASLRSLSAWLRTKKGNARHLVAILVVASGLAIPVV